MAKQSGIAALANLPKSIYSFILEARDELKKVSWPSREITIRYTIIVVIASLVVGLVTGGVDYVLTFLLEQVI